MKKILLLALALLMLCSACAAPVTPGTTATVPSSSTEPQTAQTYTFVGYGLNEPSVLNPHLDIGGALTDKSVLSLVLPPLAEYVLKNAETGEGQWIFTAATDIQDVTKDHREDLTKYGATLTAPVEEIDAGYVFEIKLRPEMCWEDGTPITAEDYLYSMEQLLHPDMYNTSIVTRESPYPSFYGNVPAGGMDFYNGGKKILVPMTAEGGYDLESEIAKETVWFCNEDYTRSLIPGQRMSVLIGNFLSYDDKEYEVVKQGYNYYTRRTRITAEKYDAFQSVMGRLLEQIKGIQWDTLTQEEQESYLMQVLWVETGELYPEVDFETVGLYKVDDYTIRYVCQEAHTYEDFLLSCSENWLVHQGLYEESKGTYPSWRTYTDYGTTQETFLSCGPYKIATWVNGKLELVQNENYWEYQKNDDGSLTSTTSFQVDGACQPQYQATSIIIDSNGYRDETASKLAFLTGELDLWEIPSQEHSQYLHSSQWHGEKGTYCAQLIFNTDLETLQALDQKSNENSVVLSNDSFRKAMSLAIDRQALAELSADWRANPFLVSSTNSYRDSHAAKEAMCQLYGLAQEDYATITGFDLPQAQALMKAACQELVQAGLYTAGEAISIQVCQPGGTAASEAETQMIALLSQSLNAAAEGSGFGAITLEIAEDGKYASRNVPGGDFAMGWDESGYDGSDFCVDLRSALDRIGWGGDLSTDGCWDPHLEPLTLEVEGQEVTMTWREWSNSVLSGGRYDSSEEAVKLQIAAQLEKRYLETYYAIPLYDFVAYTTHYQGNMLSYKVSYYTDNHYDRFGYNGIGGYGGLRLLKFNYSDAQWEAFVAENGGTLDYTK